MNRILVVAVLLLAYSHQAAAYLDPGTGSMVLQGIIAGIAVVGFTIKNYWYRIRAFFGKAAPTSVLEEDDEAPKSD